MDNQHADVRTTGSHATIPRRQPLRATDMAGLAVDMAGRRPMQVSASRDAPTLPPAIVEWVSATQTLDAARTAATYAPDAVREVVPINQIDQGREAILGRLQSVHDAFEGRGQVRTLFATNDRAVAEWVITAKYTGHLRGYPPGSGQPVTLRGVSLFPLDDGAIARETLYLDVYGLLVQLGPVSVPGSAGDETGTIHTAQAESSPHESEHRNE